MNRAARHPIARRLPPVAAPLVPTDELSRLRQALDRALSRLERFQVANQLFLHAHQQWRSGELSATEYRLVLNEVDQSRDAPLLRVRQRRVQ